MSTTAAKAPSQAPAQSELYGPGVAELSVTAPAAAYNLANGIAEQGVEVGFAEFGEDIAAGFGVSVGALMLRASVGRGHMSRTILEWGAPLAAAAAAGVNAFATEGAPHNVADYLRLGARAVTAAGTAKLVVNAWLRDK